MRPAEKEKPMSRLFIPALAEAPEDSRPILAAVDRQLGVVPNLFRLVANSPKALAAFAAFNGGLAKTLDLKTRERIALAVAEIDECGYCLSAHTYLAANLAKLPAEEIAHARRGGAGDPKVDAAVAFAAKVTRERGHVGDADIEAVRTVGYSDAEIVEIVAVVAENLFTNFLNNVADTDIDFPVVHAKQFA
jgi:uncharacterized peroxidase-related enzyme